MQPVRRVRRALSDGPSTTLASSLYSARLGSKAEHCSIPTYFFQDSTQCHRDHSLALMPLFLQPYINIILANRNSFKCLASRRALPLFQGIMQFFSLFVYSIGHFQDYKEKSICLCSQCHIACKKNYPHILTQIKQNDAIF